MNSAKLNWQSARRALFHGPVTDEKLALARRMVDEALDYLDGPMYRREAEAFTKPEIAAQYCRAKIGHSEREKFLILFLDNQHRLITSEVMFEGTIDGASVYPREVVKRALELNSAALVCAHNHPSGRPEPSAADRRITDRLVDACALVEVRIVDHIIVGENGSFTSFAQRGFI